MGREWGPRSETNLKSLCPLFALYQQQLFPLLWAAVVTLCTDPEWVRGYYAAGARGPYCLRGKGR